MRIISRKPFAVRKLSTTWLAALAAFSVGIKAQAQSSQPSYKVTVVPLAADVQQGNSPIAFNNAGQMITSAWFSTPNYYGYRISRYGADGLIDICNVNNDAYRGSFFLNQLGQIAGRMNPVAGASNFHALFFDGQNAHDLGTLGGTQSYSAGINDAGQIVGTSDTGVGTNRQGFLFGGAVMQGLNVGGVSSDATGINNGGDITGSYDTATSPTYSEHHAYVIHNGVFTDLGKLTASESRATGINDAGQIMGSLRFPDYSSHAFRYRNGVMSDLGTLGGASSTATDINAAGDVVGQSQTAIQGSSSLANHGFICGADGVMRDLGSLNGATSDSRAADINDNGQIVGWSYSWDGSQSGFVYSNGQMFDLNYSINSQLGWHITSAEFVNNSGKIAAIGHDSSGNSRALLLTPNALPVTHADNATVAQDSTDNVIRVLDNDTDADGDPLTLANYLWASNGTVKCSADNQTVLYTPNAGFVGTDTISYYASDGSGVSGGTVNVTVTANSAGLVADDQTVATNEDTPKSIVLTAHSAATQTIDSYVVTTLPAFGTLSGTAPNLVYTPNANYNGTDAFVFRAFSGTKGSNNATVNLTIKAVNDAPIASAQSVTTNEDTTKSLILSATDVDGDTLSYAVVASPSHGTLSGTAPNLIYTPNANYNGSDSFTFKANDGTVDSNVATVSLTIVAVHDPAVALPQSVQLPEDTTKAITLTATNVDGDPLWFGVLKPPTHGTLSGTAPNLVYTPNANYNGPDSFLFGANSVYDSLVSPATVSLTVTPVNDAPVSSTQSVNLDEDTSKNITLAATDVDGDALSFSVVTQPVNGTLIGTAPNVVYTPNANFNGADSFSFKANDGNLDSNISTVSITVNPVNDAPIANNQSVAVDEDLGGLITLTASDIDSPVLRYSIVSNPSHGVVSITSGSPNISYKPNAYYYGPDSFTFKANDGSLDSNTATVSITVRHVNHAPSAISQTLSIKQDTSLPVILSATDVDNDPLTYVVTAQPSHGTLSGTAPNLVYTPVAHYTGADNFSFTANDGQATSLAALVVINITRVNHPVVAVPDSKTVLQDSDWAPISVLSNDQDIDGIGFSLWGISSATSQQGGSVRMNSDNTVSYKPAPGFSGTDTFSYTIQDNYGLRSTALVTVTVTHVNHAPVSSTQSVSTNQDTAKNITLSASDVDGDALTYSVVTAPVHGTLSGTAPNLVYTPSAGYTGQDSFTFKANDGKLDSNTAIVNITVVPVNHAPVASSQSVTTTQNTAKSITLVATDVDGNNLTYAVVTQPTNGTLSGTGATLIYTPCSGFSGSDSFTFKANDGSLNSNVATISINVTPVVVASNFVVTYKVSSQWNNGFNADVTIKNNGPAVNGWTLTWVFPNGQVVSNMWNATSTQSGANVSAKDAGWNKAIPTGGTASFGFTASYNSVTNGKPTTFKLNGQTCTIAP